MTSQIKAVLWDFGGIFTPSPFGAAHAYVRQFDALANAVAAWQEPLLALLPERVLLVTVTVPPD